ncbi:Nn.00g054610.m01.CDS01 [Neocucurbitaria sp. VM-36]
MSVDLDPKYVYRGLWVDVDRGPVMGKSITTDTGTGTLIVSLLAVLVTLGTAHLWHILSFLIHQVRADGRPRDGLFRQQQALLRTLPAPSTALVDSIKLWWAWRRRAEKPFLRTILILSLALLTTVGTIAASIFSSFVVDSSNLVVLVNSPLCGAPAPDRLPSRDGYPALVLKTAVKYGPECYHNFEDANTTVPKACGTFINRYIKYDVSMGSCPFAEGMCVSGNDSEAVVMDAYLLDANKDFGMNLPADSGVQYRRKTTCSVLSKKGRTQIHNVSDFFMAFGRPEFVAGEQAISIHYGPTGSRRIANSTQMTSLAASNMTFTFDISGRIYYASSGNSAGSTFDPIPELRREDGDTGLKTIGLNGIKYLKPVNDALFSAHKPFTAIATIGETREIRNITTYSHDDPLKAIGCLQQEDFCTNLIALPANVTETNFPEANALQKAVIQLLVNTSYSFDSANPTSEFLTKAMALPPSQNVVPKLEDGMWWIELIAWERSVWASIQIAVADWAIGPTVRDGGATNWTQPSTDAERQLCHMQRMRVSGNIVNINVFALAFIIAFSFLVMIIDITLLKFLIYLSRFRRTLAPRIDRWIQDGVWQLQRRAYEGEGYREWMNLENEIPLTDKGGQKLKDLPILWVPRKSPMVPYTQAFTSTPSVCSQQPLQGSRSVCGNELDERIAKRGLVWQRFWWR